MSSAVRSLVRRIGVATAALVLVSACADQPTQPEPDILFAKGGGGGGPSVDVADPNSAPQDITLDVRVIGSGFDDGSAVKFLNGGQSTPKIVTNSSTFIDRNNIIVNITIAIDADVTLYDIEVTTSRGKKGIGSELFAVKEKGTQDEAYEMTVLDIDGFASDISDSDLMAGGLRVAPGGISQAVLFDFTGAVTILPDFSGISSEANAISPSGAWAAGRDQDVDWTGRGIVWDLTGAAPVAFAIENAPGFSTYVPAINDDGVVAGQIFDGGDIGNTQRGALWLPDGIGSWKLKVLGELPGHSTSFAAGVNNAGHIVGRSTQGFFGHAVMWTLQPDESISILDLTPNADGTGDAAAVGLTEVRPEDGTVQVVGYETVDGVLRATAWTVDVVNGVVLSTRRAPTLLRAEALNARGEVVGSTTVWDLVDAAEHSLPPSGENCFRGARLITAGGVVIGWADVSTKRSSTCTRSGKGVERRVVMWTKIP